MTSTAFQASLVFKPLSLSPSFPSSSQRLLGISVNHRFCRRRLPRLTFNYTPESSLSNSSILISDSSPEIAELVVGDGSSGQIPREIEPGSGGAGEVKSEELAENVDAKSRKPIVVSFMGLFALVKKVFEKLSEWIDWDLSKRLEQWTANADAKPNDVATQTCLLVDLNFIKRHDVVIKRFEEGTRAVDSRAVVEYLRALVKTNTFDEYLPDEDSGKPDNVPLLLEELIQHASRAQNVPTVDPASYSDDGGGIAILFELVSVFFGI